MTTKYTWGLGSLAFMGVLFVQCKPSQTTSNTTNGKAFNGETAILIQTDTSYKGDTLRLYAWEGIQAVEKGTAVASKNATGSTFKFAAARYPAGLYYVGRNLEDVKPILIGAEREITIQCNAPKLSQATFKSANNAQYDQTIIRINEQAQMFSDLLYEYQQHQGNAEKLKQLDAQLALLDIKRKSLLDSTRATASNIARVAALYTYLSYPNNRKTPAQAEADYFAASFFQFVDLQDTVYARLPHFYEAIKNYTSNLTQLGLNNTQQQTYLDSLLAKIPATAPQMQPALLGVTFGVIGRNNELFFKYADKYNQLYSGRNADLDKFIQQQLAVARGPLATGTDAPTFTELTPDGKKLSLSDLRGKVVLLDFWASWCGPCRRENPNVVRVYDKYKDKGFEILGISLDQNRENWLGAIAADKLTWLHVSDLKGWQSAVGKLYGVSGIPFTVLVDKQGKVIAKGLRGAALEAKLAELFGN